MNILIVEDDETRVKWFRTRCVGHSLTVIAHADKAIAFLGGNTPDLVFLDHDLGGEVFQDTDREDCGSEVARWLVTNKPDIPVVLHSLNPGGLENMYRILKRAVKEPFCWTFSYEKFDRLLKHMRPDLFPSEDSDESVQADN